MTQDPNNADWYLIHYDYDEFDIVIPWLDDYSFVGDDAANTYELIFDLDETDNDILSESMYDATAEVVLTYTAAVGPDAINGTVYNEASLSWEHTDGSGGNDTPEKTEIKVHNLGLTKIANDSAKSRLAGAIFELYSDADCTIPVYVIPTGAPGVYILDDIDTVVSGIKRITSREKYAGDDLNAWLAADPNPDADGTNRRNDMITPAGGQIVVLGLEDGTYYMKETEAPAGYNKLSLPVEIEVGGTSVSTYDSGYQVYGTTVVNNRGIELPSTGGEGTFWLITIGTIMVIGFAVFLITHKKMSVYTD
jgi:LPXTG-motif cell wall-anchored protein